MESYRINWLISLSIMTSGCIPVVARVRISFLPEVEWYLVVCRYHISSSSDFVSLGRKKRGVVTDMPSLFPFDLQQFKKTRKKTSESLRRVGERWGRLRTVAHTGGWGRRRLEELQAVVGPAHPTPECD